MKPIIEITSEISEKQLAFINAKEDEVLFGGAAGGGKSYGQLVDALIFALRYPKSKQLILRRTYPELEKSLIRAHLEFYPLKTSKTPQGVYSYNAAAHVGQFVNGSIIDFGYCAGERDVYQYQSAEYDIIRFDELTHFTETMYTYLISRVRGKNGYPKQLKSSTNPGNIGHAWVKARFIDPSPASTAFDTPTGNRVFIPSLIADNPFLTRADPQYIRRLDNLPEQQRKALKFGEWDIFEGQYFTEFDEALHVVKPRRIPREWARYFTMDYGLDMLAGYWIALDERGHALVYRELYEPGLIISAAAKRIRELTPADEHIEAYYAPPDLWNRRQDSGRSAAEIFAEGGIPLTMSKNDRVLGWLDMHEWLMPKPDEFDGLTPAIQIFDNCRNLIRCIPALVHSEKDPNDTANEPHEYTHAPDALRYFCAGRPQPAAALSERDDDVPDEDEQAENLLNFGR